MAEQVILDGVSTDTSGTYTLTASNPNLQIDGLGGVTGQVNQPRVVISATTDGTNYSQVGSYYDDGFHGTAFKSGVKIKAESKNIDAGQSVTVSIFE